MRVQTARQGVSGFGTLPAAAHASSARMGQPFLAAQQLPVLSLRAPGRERLGLLAGNVPRGALPFAHPQAVPPVALRLYPDGLAHWPAHAEQRHALCKAHASNYLWSDSTHKRIAEPLQLPGRGSIHGNFLYVHSPA